MTAETGYMLFEAVQPRRSDIEGPTDELLFRQLLGGDVVAGELLARRFHEPLMRYLQRLVGNDQVAEEIYQATWLSVLENLSRFDPASNSGGFKAWLFRIATNKANDTWRSNGREKIAKEQLRLVADEEAPNAAHRIEGSEEQSKLIRAIERLPHGQKQVLILRYYSGMKFVDIAKTLGCPLNTALGRMHKAMQKLKELMGE